MIKKNLYRYVGRNGIITSLVYLEDAHFYPMLRLAADSDKVLTNGTVYVKAIDIFADELDQWHEIDEQGQN